ncbi:MAG: hypothetical protein GY820_39385 [Gammaproteobacteria bacterium]|nr:hypothetical protein [Gammaproteobacteria bacterium]
MMAVNLEAELTRLREALTAAEKGDAAFECIVSHIEEYWCEEVRRPQEVGDAEQDVIEIIDKWAEAHRRENELDELMEALLPGGSTHIDDGLERVKILAAAERERDEKEDALRKCDDWLHDALDKLGVPPNAHAAGDIRDGVVARVKNALAAAEKRAEEAERVANKMIDDAREARGGTDTWEVNCDGK